jgi:hypothetical protein
MRIVGLELPEERNKILRRFLAERASEWQSKIGIRRIIARIRIRFWAWWRTEREMLSRSNKSKPRKLSDL